jgi:hypothetical protein
VYITNVICLILHSVDKASNLGCMISMGIGIIRGPQRDHGRVMMGGHACQAGGKGPKICSLVFISLENNFTLEPYNSFQHLKCDFAPGFSEFLYAKQ